MDDNTESIAIHNSRRVSNKSTGSEIPSQVLFMNTHDMPSRRDAQPPSSAYYQVATPKSPHELALDGDDEAGHGESSGSHASGSLGHHDDHSHLVNMGKSTRESEEVERLKYETAKNEILEQLHLHTLINHKDLQGLQLEIRRVDAQMKLLEKLHGDKDLLAKIEEYHSRENENKKLQLSEINALTNSSFGSLVDPTMIKYSSKTPPNMLLSVNSGVPIHHYHTRSKSHGNVAEVPHLRPANSAIIDLRMAGAKSIPNGNTNQGIEFGSEIQTFRPNQMNLHHRRNYSSTSLTSNSGVVGKTEDDKAIFRRYDGILIVITCANCNRSGFTSAQGIVNHARLKHSKTYSSQPLAVLNNQRILEDTKQDPQVLQKFKQLGKDPKHEYLPCEIAIPSSGRKSSQRELSPKNLSAGGTEIPSNDVTTRNVAHLEKMYDKDDFKELVDMVNEAQNDLDVVLKQSESDDDLSDSEEGPKNRKRQNSESEYVSYSVNNERVNPRVADDIAESNDSEPCKNERKDLSVQAGPRKILRKRKSEADEQEKELKEKLRPAEKRARPDALALSSIPDHEKRSSHYNLRAKSKLRGINGKYD